MKTKLVISALLGITAFAFILSSSTGSKAVNPPLQPYSGNISSEYLIGAMDCGIDRSFSYLNELKLNLWHKYPFLDRLNDNNTRGWDWYLGEQGVDKLYTTDTQYSGVVTNRLEQNLNNTNNPMRTLMERPKIEQLAYGQRSNYQCEAEPSHLNEDLWFYAFNNHDVMGQYGSDYPDNTQYGEGQWVRRCVPDPYNAPDGQGYVVRRLRANNEQCNMMSPIGQIPGDTAYSWYIKPSIRADKNYVDNHTDEPICRIDIYNFDGDLSLIKSTEIRARNFKDVNNYYDGKYHEEFRFTGSDSTLEFFQWQAINFNPNKSGWAFNSRGYLEPDDPEPSGCSHVDIRVYWYGNCEIFIDYVRVDNDVADKLFKGYYEEQNTTHDWLHWEAELANYNSSPLKFYIEEFEFNNIPCMSYVSRKLRDYSGNPNLSLMSVVNLTQYNLQLPVYYVSNKKVSASHILRYLIDSVGESQVFSEPYSLTGYIEGSNFNDPSYVPNTFENYSYNVSEGKLGQPATVQTYEDWLQNHLDDETSFSFITKHGYFTWYLKTMDTMSKANNIAHINMPQTHLWFSRNGQGDIEEALREPTNEELKMITFIPITYGARGTWYFMFGGWGDIGSNTYGRGLTDPILSDPYFTPRTTNVYGQNKWQNVIDINTKLKAWGPTLMSFNNTDRHSYIYRLEDERNSLLDNSYFRYLLTYKPGTGQPTCNEWLNPGGMPAPPNEPGLIYECKEYTYLQVATFKENIIKSLPYFMIVNRRCSPVKENNPDGGRKIKVLFDNSHPSINSYYDWKIKDIESGTYVGQFNRLQNTWVDLGWFEPGGGKLYKLEPTVNSGGTLLGDEVVESGEVFTCEDTVWTNGYDLTIEDGVTINFSDSAKFIVHGGTFQMGNSSHSGPNTINIDADEGSSWKGFEFDTCNVKIYGVNFTGLANDSISMLTFIDCPLIDLRSNSFSLGTGSNKGAVDITYSGSYQSGVTDNVYIANNTFLSSSSVLPYVKVMAYSSITVPVIVEGNSFTGSSTALFLNNIQGGAIKSNTFSNFGSSITALTSSIDVFNNSISSTGAYGLEALEGTELKMSYAGDLLVGGRNNITNSGTSVYNIYLENSYFLMDEGENIFDIGDDSYHLYGWFPGSYSGSYEETENCFKVEGTAVDPPLHYVTLGVGGTPITGFVFTPYLTGCTQGGEGDMMVINLGNGIYDTIMYEGQGQGGSESENAKVKSEKSHPLFHLPLGKGETEWGSYMVLTPKSIYDSISISMRYRNYANVKLLCLQLLNSYPDSVQSLGAVSKLYLAVSKTDTTTQGITDLKTLYENLILNHAGNISLVKRCNYYVQKCKVLLHQYSSALSGFQQIINNNPASYEGLIARWDYMATSLLMQGQGGSERNWDLGFGNWNLNKFDESDKSDESDKFNDDKFTKEERKQIKQAVNTALEVSKYTEKKREEVLTELSTRGDVNATKQLKVLKSLSQTVKVEKPKNISEHMKIVSGDIQKVFVNPNAGKNTNVSFIPTVFNLSQNYPNPFNPVTKINYDIPQNSKVKLTVYDILGREVKTLVNEFKQPGRYVVEFNGTNLASGVYFYRIEAGDYTASKKMVLVK